MYENDPDSHIFVIQYGWSTLDCRRSHVGGVFESDPQYFLFVSGYYNIINVSSVIIDTKRTTNCYIIQYHLQIKTRYRDSTT